MAKQDIAQIVTDQIIEALENGVAPWRKPWTVEGPTFPLRHCGTPYKGMNVILLWLAAHKEGYTGSHWLTFNQVRKYGGRLENAKGKGVKVVFYKPLKVKDKATGEDRVIPMLRSYTVFNQDLCKGLPERFEPAATVEPSFSVDREIYSALVDSNGANVSHGGSVAAYNPVLDSIRMPNEDRFESAGSYYATLAHELAHWTGHKSRLDRNLSGSFGTADYAFEELVAEISSAMVCSRLGIGGTAAQIEANAAYIGSWLKKLKSDKRYILRAAKLAGDACEYLVSDANACEVAA